MKSLAWTISILILTILPIFFINACDKEEKDDDSGVKDDSNNNENKFECYQMTCDQSAQLVEAGEDNVCEEAEGKIDYLCSDDELPDFDACLCDCTEMKESSDIFNCFNSCLGVYCKGTNCTYLQELKWAGDDCEETFIFVSTAHMITYCYDCIGECARAYMDKNDCDNFANCTESCFY